MGSRRFSVELVFDDGDQRESREDLEPLMSIILSHSPDLAGVEARVGPEVEPGVYEKGGDLFCRTCGTVLGAAEDEFAKQE